MIISRSCRVPNASLSMQSIALWSVSWHDMLFLTTIEAYLISVRLIPSSVLYSLWLDDINSPLRKILVEKKVTRLNGFMNLMKSQMNFFDVSRKEINKTILLFDLTLSIAFWHAWRIWEEKWSSVYSSHVQSTHHEYSDYHIFHLKFRKTTKKLFQIPLLS